MIDTIFIFLLFLCIGLFILGFKYVGQIKYGAQLFHIGSAFLLLMCGLIVLTQGVSFKSGQHELYTYENVSNSTPPFRITSIDTSDSYTNLKGFQNSYGLSVLLIFLSIAMFIYTFFEWKYGKSSEQSNTSYEEEE